MSSRRRNPSAQPTRLALRRRRRGLFIPNDQSSLRSFNPAIVRATINLDFGGISSTAGGVLNNIFALSAFQSVPAADFAGFAGLYDAYRIRGGKMTLWPTFWPSTSSITGGPVVMVFDEDDAVNALTNYSGANSYRTRRVFNAISGSMRPAVLKFKCPPGSPQTLWMDTNSNPFSSVKLYGTNLSVSVNYFQACTLECYFEFRSRR
jgi:hypothetical protein